VSNQLNFLGQSEGPVKYKPYYMMDVEIAASRKLFNVISTFSGGGGSSIGYKLAGGDVIVANEFVEEAAKTYLTNSPRTKMLTEDIKELNGRDFLKLVNFKKDQLDILDGSPPCSSFSLASMWSKSKKKSSVKKYSDNKKVENIEDLFVEFIRVAEEIKPKVIIAENVPSMMHKGNRHYFDAVIQGFFDIGYYANAKVLDASHFYVPQSRNRCIFIGVRQDVADTINLDRFDVDTIHPKGTHEYISIKEAIDNVKSNSDHIEELVEYYERGGFQKKWMSQIPKNPTKLIKGSHLHPTKSLFNLIRPVPDNPSPSLTQLGQQKSLSGVFHYNEDRKLSIEELMRLTSLPEDFKLTGTFDQRAERVCRMVPPRLMFAVAKAVYEKILSPYNEKMLAADQDEDKPSENIDESFNEKDSLQLFLF